MTIHGSLQAERLGQHFARAGLRFTHIFSSDLQRAYKTADAIRLAQGSQHIDKKHDESIILKLRVLREQDFGSLEGKPIHARQRGLKMTGKEAHQSQRGTDPNFKDIESRESMIQRMDDFIHDYILPLLCHKPLEPESIICIVSHGIILSQLWRCFLKLFPRQSVILPPGTSVGTSAPIILEHLGGWSNTGYLELDVHDCDIGVENSSDDHDENLSSRTPTPTDSRLNPVMPKLKMTIKTINGKDHLKSLKRTRGGVGSSKHDEGQKKIELFFKKAHTG